MFRFARLKLTAWYLLIIMLLSISFSFVIYQVSSRELRRIERQQRLFIERRFSNGSIIFKPFPPYIDPNLFPETRNRLLLLLIIINSGIFFVSGTLGYFLAGRTLKPIKEMIDEQNRFISDASHELRTPLTALKSSIEVNLRNPKITLKEAKNLLAESIEEVNKLQSLTDGLLSLSQYQKQKNQLVFQKLYLSTIVEDAINKIQALAQQKKIQIKNTVKNLEIEGNKDGLIELFIILLDNAVKYSHEEGEVEISSQKNDGFVTISIKDNGIGISSEDLPHIFDRFYRADSARSKKGAGGFGLGLSIAQKIVENHHGFISVDSKIGKGSTFKIKLPLRQPSVFKKEGFFS